MDMNKLGKSVSDSNLFCRQPSVVSQLLFTKQSLALPQESTISSTQSYTFHI